MGRAMKHLVQIGPLPLWLPTDRYLGAGDWTLQTEDARIHASAVLDTATAADLAARVRGVVIAGAPIEFRATPALRRHAVREGRLQEARRQRDRSPGFTRPGVRIDDDAKLGLTPEQLALELGQLAKGVHVVDSCCGAGGNAIGFARAGCRVTAIEVDATRLAMAKHNAGVYGVSDRIEWICGDARTVLASHGGKDSLWFLDVPWLAPTADRQDFAPKPGLRSLLDDLLALRPAGQRAWAKVPAGFDPSLVNASSASAWFGTAAGDARRVKFLVLQFDG